MNFGDFIRTAARAAPDQCVVWTPVLIEQAADLDCYGDSKPSFVVKAFDMLHSERAVSHQWSLKVLRGNSWLQSVGGVATAPVSESPPYC